MTDPRQLSTQELGTDKKLAFNNESDQDIHKQLERFTRPFSERIDFKAPPSRVEMAKKGGAVFHGGDGLSLMVKIENYFIDRGLIIPDLKFCTLKSLDNGNFIINNFKTWDLLMYDSSAAEVGKLEGGLEAQPPLYFKTLSLNSNNPSSVLWLSSPTSLSIVTLPALTSI